MAEISQPEGIKTPSSSYRGYRFPAAIISNVPWLNTGFTSASVKRKYCSPSAESRSSTKIFTKGGRSFDLTMLASKESSKTVG